MGRAQGRIGGQPSPQVHLRKEANKTSCGQIRELRVGWARGGLWLVGADKASCKRCQVLLESGWGHSTTQRLCGQGQADKSPD